MRGTLAVVCLLAAFAAVALSQVSGSAEVLFTVPEADKTCSTVDECTTVANQCCASSNCGYSTVSKSKLATYEAKYADLSKSCTAVCTAVACLTPKIVCNLGSGAGAINVGVCAFETTSTPPPAATCKAVTTTECAYSCISSQIDPPVGDPTACKPGPVLACRNACNQAVGVTCGPSPTGACGFTGDKLAACYQSCEPQPPPPPPPPPSTCKTVTTGECAYACISNLIDPPIADPLVCKPGPAVGCRNACNQALGVTCNKTALGTCGFIGGAKLEACYQSCLPPTPTSVPSCAVKTSSTCDSVCVSSAYLGPPLACQPTAVNNCSNACKSKFLTCKFSDAVSVTGGSTSAGSCQYVATDVLGYQKCLDTCRPVDNTTVTQCHTITGPNCGSQCVSQDIPEPMTLVACTATKEVQCYNACQAKASCSPTAAGCRFVPSNEIEYNTCIKSCASSTIPPCTKTGCNGEICSAVATVSSICLAPTCESKCYASATCGRNADASCGFTVTDAIKTCLANCKATEPPPPVPPPNQCNISGCQRQLCLPANTKPMPCTDVIVEPSCETKCLQYANCQPTSVSASGTAGTSTGGVSVDGSTYSCGWVPKPANPGAYGDCLKQCSTSGGTGTGTKDGCFISGCGAVCDRTAQVGFCSESFAKPDCPTSCKLQFTPCSLTPTGCNFVSVDGLAKCLAACPSTDPALPAPVCPDGVPAAQCLLDPCATATCAAHPLAKCRANYCGGCRAQFFLNDQPVSCDDSCAGLPCDDCSKKPECAFCSGDYATVDGAKRFGFCVAAKGEAADKCLASNNRLLPGGTATTCPAPTTTGGSADGGVKTTAGDSGAVQNEVAVEASGKPVLQYFAIVITLVVNQSDTTGVGEHHVSVFVDLIGDRTPTEDDKTQVCDILKNALKKTDNRITDILAVKCKLEEKSTKKRDVGYVADVAFPNNNNPYSASDATTLFASFSAMLCVVLAMFF